MEIKQKHLAIALPAVALVALITVGALMPSGQGKDIGELRASMAKNDVQLQELKQKYGHHASIVEEHQKILVDLSAQADTLRKANEDFQAKITSLVEGKE